MPIHGGAGGWDLEGSAPPEAVHFMQCLAQGNQWQSSTGAGQQGPATHPVRRRALKSWTCSWPLPHRESQEGSGGAAASGGQGDGGRQL